MAKKSDRIYRTYLERPGTEWLLPYESFITSEIWGFEHDNYTYFLDNVKTKEQLVEGLASLSPSANDALYVALSMDDMDFCSFKLALVHERRICKGEIEGPSLMSQHHLTLLMPEIFFQATLIAQKMAVPLGVAIQRLLESGYG